MLGQTFQPSDFAAVATLVLLEGLLSGDNALVLAIMVRHLPEADRKRALLYGMGGAFLFRFLAIALARLILGIWWLQGLGAGYLLYLPIKHFIAARRPQKAAPLGLPFWNTVLAVELTDIAFAMDSVLAAVSFIGDQKNKLWVVYVGAALGIVLLRLAANFFVKLLDRFPGFEHVAYALVGWIGVKLLVLAVHNFDTLYPDMIAGRIHEMAAWLFWSVLAVLALGGTAWVVRSAPGARPKPLT